MKTILILLLMEILIEITIQHICLKNSICANVELCAQRSTYFNFCNFIISFHFYMLSKSLGLQFLDGWRGQNKL